MKVLKLTHKKDDPHNVYPGESDDESDIESDT
jgi:hypothetical protein